MYTPESPDNILCSATHEWALEENNVVLVGLTDYVIEHSGEIVSVELPEVETMYTKDEICASVETTKGAKEIYMPTEGKIIEINEELINSPELINDNPLSVWLFKVEPVDFNRDSQNLLDYNDYREEL